MMSWYTYAEGYHHKRNLRYSREGEHTLDVALGASHGSSIECGEYAQNPELINLMRLHYFEGGSLAAICAAPGLVISQLPSMSGIHFTCYDGFEDGPVARGGIYEKKPAVTDGNIITGRGPGCGDSFAVAVNAEQSAAGRE